MLSTDTESQDETKVSVSSVFYTSTLSDLAFTNDCRTTESNDVYMSLGQRSGVAHCVRPLR